MAGKKRADDVISFKLRMPEGLRQKLEAEAKKAERSINSEILWRLGQTFEAPWQRFIAGVEDRERRDAEWREKLAQDPKVQEAIRDAIAKHITEKP
jgi:hypothetical protein